MRRRTIGRGFIVLAALAGMAGCVRRELTVESDPPGALVYLNGQEVGRTPVTRPFTFYGTYDVVLRLEGYETLKTQKLVLAPWWQWVPIDLVAEAFPLTDRQRIAFTLEPARQDPNLPVAPGPILDRAAELRTQLPETRPTTRP